MIRSRSIFVILLAFSASATAQAGRFPRQFKWCVATAAHQVEGGNRASDWWEFEKIPGVIRDGKPSGEACDHWNRLEQDTALLSELGVSQYRFSVEWARIEPKEGEFDRASITHYQKEITLLKKQGIEPFVTLHHFVLPKWVADRGGFAWDGIGEAFERYARKVYTELGAGVTDWTTLNEPQSLVAAGYIEGVFPPQKKDLKAIRAPLIGMIRSHARAYRALHELAAKASRPIRVGIAHHLRVFEPSTSWNPIDRWLTGIVDHLANWALLDTLRDGSLKLKIPFTLEINEQIPEATGTQDFLGLNYYSRDLISFSLFRPGFIDRGIKAGAAVTDLNWEIFPEGIYQLVKELHLRYPTLPILVTENGIADRNDSQREGFMRSHLGQILRAIGEGIPVEGYCHWTLMDNYEWAEGFAPRFGLYQNETGEQIRRLRPSGRWFSVLTRTGELK